MVQRASPCDVGCDASKNRAQPAFATHSTSESSAGVPFAADGSVTDVSHREKSLIELTRSVRRNAK